MRCLLLAFVMAGILSCSVAQENTSLESPENISKHPGFYNFYYNKTNGKIWLEIDKWDTEFLYVSYLATGVGSNDIGLDRNQLGDTRIVKFVRMGAKVFLLQSNYQYRAESNNANERRSVTEAFAQSMIWSFDKIIFKNDALLLDATEFFCRDAHNVTGTLSRAEQGNYRLDSSGCAIYFANTKNFPKNTEVEAMVTFSGSSPGNFVRSVVPSPSMITVRQHHSFVELPDNGYTPRQFDPRCGYFNESYMDFATPIENSIYQRVISRHRLKKKNPKENQSEAEKPIIYYVDSGVPEPILSAVIEGAQWWNEAFEAIGYKDAFQVKVLPSDVDPMDIRYNVIQWVHRSTRGWSYGSSVRDPRTGEIIKGLVTLGSLRVRQDFLIAQGLIGFSEKNAEQKMREMALARIRQLAAHEVGHTLGIRHNYAASVNNRASVMDYPHPYVVLDNRGNIDLSQAYAVGVGEWDKLAIRYGYQEFPMGDEQQQLQDILTQGAKDGLEFISDEGARSLSSAHPNAHLWDNGNAIAELERIIEIRKTAIEKFSLDNIRMGEPVALLEEVFVPIYLFHRYQIEATGKIIAGVKYQYSVKGDGQEQSQMVDGATQRKALNIMLKTLDPEFLTIPETLEKVFVPRPPGFSRSRETFSSQMGVMFDPLAAAKNSVGLTFQVIFHQERAARLVYYHSKDSSLPSLEEVIDKILANTWKSSFKTGKYAEIQKITQMEVLYYLMKLARSDSLPQVSAIALWKLEELKVWLHQTMKKQQNIAARAHYYFAYRQIVQFQNSPNSFRLPQDITIPDGSPIGSCQCGQ